MSRQDERMAMLEAECDNLRQKVAYLENRVLELEREHKLPKKNNWSVPQWSVDVCEK